MKNLRQELGPGEAIRHFTFLPHGPYGPILAQDGTRPCFRSSVRLVMGKSLQLLQQALQQQAGTTIYLRLPLSKNKDNSVRFRF